MIEHGLEAMRLYPLNGLLPAVRKMALWEDQ